MTYLILCVAATTLITVFFKLFDRFGVQTFQAIVWNYLMCFVMGNIMGSTGESPLQVWTQDWFPITIAVGFLFVSIFYAMARCTASFGMSLTTVSAKLSVVIPVTFSVWVMHEKPVLMQLLGIPLSFVAVLLMNIRKSSATPRSIWVILLPAIVFLGSGSIDTIVKYLEATYIPPSNANMLVSGIFINAFCWGMLMLLAGILTKRIQFSAASMLWGLALGIPNYFSMYFLLRALEGQPASLIFPVNNIAVVVTGTLVGLIFFRERLQTTGWVGLLLAVCSIVMITSF